MGYWELNGDRDISTRHVLPSKMSKDLGFNIGKKPPGTSFPYDSSMIFPVGGRSVLYQRSARCSPFARSR